MSAPRKEINRLSSRTERAYKSQYLTRFPRGTLSHRVHNFPFEFDPFVQAIRLLGECRPAGKINALVNKLEHPGGYSRGAKKQRPVRQPLRAGSRNK